MKPFGCEDQRRFAHLSGDHNPLHLDPLLCRRLLFGRPVVHGVHVLLCCLERVLEEEPSTAVLEELTATFHNPLPLNTPWEIELDRPGPHAFAVESPAGYCDLRGRFSASPPPPWTGQLPSHGPTLACQDHTLAEISAAEGRLPLWVDPGELQAMFPHLAARLPLLQAAQILATTRLTGMECPGRRSVFHSLKLRFEGDCEAAEVAYRVCRADPRFSRLELAITGAQLEGVLSTFLRPPPVRQAPFSEVAGHVRADEFRGQRALVVGGSRGLGEVTAKILAAGGASVRITCHQGREEAAQVCRQLGEGGADGRFLPLDVTGPVAAALEALGDWAPTHVYYFATPRIAAPSRNAPFSGERFRDFCRYYLEGIAALVESLAARGVAAPALFYPSSTAVDSPSGEVAEYAAAKAAGECLCRSLLRRSLVGGLHVPRLPQMRTDQTAGIIPRPAADPLEAMLPEIRALAHA